MKIKISEATLTQLDWAVAKCEGELDECDYYLNEYTGAFMLENGDASAAYCPSTLWNHGGPIIERERISIRPDVAGPDFRAFVIRPPNGLSHRHIGSTPLVAAMRCYVASKLGEYVDVPF